MLSERLEATKVVVGDPSNLQKHSSNCLSNSDRDSDCSTVQCKKDALMQSFPSIFIVVQFGKLLKKLLSILFG